MVEAGPCSQNHIPGRTLRAVSMNRPDVAVVVAAVAAVASATTQSSWTLPVSDLPQSVCVARLGMVQAPWPYLILLQGFFGGGGGGGGFFSGFLPLEIPFITVLGTVLPFAFNPRLLFVISVLQTLLPWPSRIPPFRRAPRALT